MSRTIHAARPGLPGDHRTDGLHCPCDPHRLMDINEPGRMVVVHRPMRPRSDGPTRTVTPLDDRDPEPAA